MKFPPAIIFVNNDISDGSLEKIQSQLFICETMDGYEFDARVAADPNYPTLIHRFGWRILVKKDPSAVDVYRNIADVVLFVKAGLAAVEQNNIGPPGLTLPIMNLNIFQILRYNNSQYVMNLPNPPSYPYVNQTHLGGIFAIQATDSSGVYEANTDNEYNNEDFINRK